MNTPLWPALVRRSVVLASRAAVFPVLLGFGSCEPEPALTWFGTCGDPVCGGYSGPWDGVSACTDEQEGAGCEVADQTCDPASDCNALLVCSDVDPTTEGCPISRRRFKRDVAYLSAEAIRREADRALAMRLATWRYQWEDDSTPVHLGFVIDDVEGSAAVTGDGDHVDLYGYTSITLAAVQDQEVRLRRQEAEIAELRAELKALRASVKP